MTAEEQRPGPLEKIPSWVVAVEDYAGLARERLTEEAWAYFSGGAGDETTLRENSAAFAKWRIVPRVLADMTAANTRVPLFGRVFEHPLLVAPMAFHKLAHAEGERATALGAAALEAGMVVSTQASMSLEELASGMRGPLWFQLYLRRNRGETLELVRRAELAGYEALVVTVDAPVNGVRNREQRAGFTLPPGIEAVNLRGMASTPAVDSVMDAEFLTTLPQWQDLAWLRSVTRLPVLLKGVLAAEDAARAVMEGMDGLVVSNHGGRTLDSTPATLEVLPEVVARVGGKVPVLMDGGIRRGTDVFKALALGASAVMVGRPVLYGLAAAGATGVAHVLKILRTELEVTMLLAGCATVAGIKATALRRQGQCLVA